MTDRPDLDELKNEFQELFSRLEGALKRTGRLKPRKGAAEADWHAFGNEIDQAFTDTREADEALRRPVEYILTAPPKRQDVDEDSLVWKDVPASAATETALVLTYIGRVRNNLVHGGKYNGTWFDPERSEPLLRHGMTILHRCLSLSPEVDAAFRE